jgi:shikimate 5-dehydrogenase
MQMERLEQKIQLVGTPVGVGVSHDEQEQYYQQLEADEELHHLEQDELLESAAYVNVRGLSINYVCKLTNLHTTDRVSSSATRISVGGGGNI